MSILKQQLLDKINNKTAKVGVVGLGYVGLPLAVEKAHAGYQTIGFDVQDKKVNMVNQRREFFNVTLEEIEKVVRDNFDKTVEFTEIAPAEQYRETLMLKKHI